MAPAGNALVFSTYLGGASFSGNFGQAIAVDSAGSAYVTGTTNSAHFPVTNSAFLKTYNSVTGTAFVTKFSAPGALVYSTYLGGSKAESGNGIAVDTAGYAYVAGFTTSADFPTKAAFQQTMKNVHGNGFVTKLAPAGDSLVYSTFLGGSGIVQPMEGGDSVAAVAVDSQGNAYVTGATGSLDFPTTSSAFQPTLKTVLLTPRTAFVTKFGPAGGLVYSTYLGGTDADQWGSGIAVDSAGSAYVAGETGRAISQRSGHTNRLSGTPMATRLWPRCRPRATRWSTNVPRRQYRRGRRSKRYRR